MKLARISLLFLLFTLISNLGGIMEIHGSEFFLLPEPSKKGRISLEESIFLRKSVREFSDQPLTLEELSQILWASQGKVKSGRRSAPSAGALYPLEIYVVSGNIETINPGIYRYDFKRHGLSKILEGDRRSSLASAALGQYWVKNAAVDVILTAIFERTTAKYGERGVRYVFIEAGHVAQNILLQAVSLGLGAVPVGAFYDEEVRKTLNLPQEEKPVYIIPIGREKQRP